jgi:hypothetical protein
VSNNTIYKVDSAGYQTTYYTGPTSEENGTLAFDSTFTYLYSVRRDTGTNAISIYKYQVSVPDPGTIVIGGLGLQSVNSPICIDSAGNLYYPDSTGSIIIKYDINGESNFCDLTLEGLSAVVSITISSTGGNFMYLYYNDPAGFVVSKIRLSDGEIINPRFIERSAQYNQKLITNSSGIFVITNENVLKYSYSGTLQSSSYITPATLPDKYSTGSFDNTNRYLFMVKYTDTTSSYSIVTTRAPPILCFKEGSKILCFQGTEEKYIDIQDIRKDMLVKTSQSGYKKVDMIGTTVLYNDHTNNNFLDNLYICKKENYPELTEDLIITGSHSILVRSITDTEREMSIKIFGKIYVTENKYRLAACIDSRAKPYEVNEKVNIWHLSLEHENKVMNYGIYANGLLVESASKRMMGEIAGMKLV